MNAARDNRFLSCLEKLSGQIDKAGEENIEIIREAMTQVRALEAEVAKLNNGCKEDCLQAEGAKLKYGRKEDFG